MKSENFIGKVLPANSTPHVDISISPFVDNSACVARERLFSAGRSDFYGVPSGYQQDIYGTICREKLLWTILANPDFSRFSCSLHVKNFPSSHKPVVDRDELAFNQFLLKHTVLNNQGIIIHAAGGKIQGKGIVFAAPSGTGKSTLGQLLLQDPHIRLFSEERLILRLQEKRWHVWGTPWRGEGDIASNNSAPLDALVFLRQSLETKICQLEPAIGLKSLLQTASIPWYGQEWADKGISICETLAQDVAMYELAFRPDESAVYAVERLAAEL
ncbi:MAG: hypothetical protein Q3M24_04200 [Candidatus Electrothrix aestuarii]|uniref:Hpr(Ser) kinase/phosphatase n=1 Tax=Candidatus Electrothrix aestuarii TaxID=3062594 RepID=A0AAU8LYM3_9BACT